MWKWHTETRWFFKNTDGNPSNTNTHIDYSHIFCSVTFDITLFVSFVPFCIFSTSNARRAVHRAIRELCVRIPQFRFELPLSYRFNLDAVLDRKLTRNPQTKAQRPRKQINAWGSNNGNSELLQYSRRKTRPIERGRENGCDNADWE